jgi:hypothetical protein
VGDLIIYGLIDPRTAQLRYVGLSTYGDRRPKEHLTPSARKGSRHINKWLKALWRDAHQRPEIITLEVCASALALDDAETYWIGIMRYIGCDLVNHKEGGRVARGWKHSAATRKKQSKASKGKPKSAEHRRALTGRPVSAETRAKISRALKGVKPAPKTPEGLARLRAAKLGKPLSEEIRAKMRAGWARWRVKNGRIA